MHSSLTGCPHVYTCTYFKSSSQVFFFKIGVVPSRQLFLNYLNLAVLSETILKYPFRSINLLPVHLASFAKSTKMYTSLNGSLNSDPTLYQSFSFILTTVFLNMNKKITVFIKNTDDKKLFNVDTCNKNKSHIQTNIFKLILQKFPERSHLLFF